VGVTPSVPAKANSGVRARVPAAGKMLEGDDKPTLLREDQHYLHYITIITITSGGSGHNKPRPRLRRSEMKKTQQFHYILSR